MGYGVTVYDDFYVMQNEHGLIKIGHSGNPETRRRALEQTEGCRVEIVLILPDKGPREEAIHRRLKRFRIIGEWFEGHDEARLAIQKHLNGGKPLPWPFAMSDDAAADWLDDLAEQRARRERLGELQRFLRGAFGFKPDRFLDARIWRLFWLSETGEETVSDFSSGADCVEVTGWREGEDPIPPYSTDLEAAMSLWPEDARPNGYPGAAVDCCLDALRLRLARMPRPARRKGVRKTRVRVEFDFSD